MLKLNPEQLEAVEHGAGPLLVIAGPGSGKTRVITQRIVHLLERVPGLQPQNILALTYTDKAAAEMEHRVRQALPWLEKSPHISTFHAFCYHLLRQRQFERRLLDKVDVWIFLRRRMASLELERYQKLAEPGAFLHNLNDFFSRCQDELVESYDFAAYVRKVEEDFLSRAAAFAADRAVSFGPATWVHPAESPDLKLEQEEVARQKELARVFRNSRRLIEEAGASSLGSLISEAVRLLDRDPEMLERCRAQYQYVLVDEFQDTNFAQVELLRRLLDAPLNITAVGDDDQAIYRFRGASHGAFQMFDEAFPGHQTVYLDRNYRSTRRILHAAGVVIGKNDRYENKSPLKTENPEGPSVYLAESPDYESEAVWVADEVDRLARRGRAFGEVAVLYRAHHHRDLLVREFRCRRVPFAIRQLSVLSTALLRDLVAYLSLVQSPHDNISLTRVLLAPRWRFPDDLALAIRRQAVKDRCSIWSAVQAMERTLFSTELKNSGWPELDRMLGELRRCAESVPVTAVFDRLVEQLDLAFVPGDPDRINLETFREFLKGWEQKSETAKLREFMEYFQYFVEAGGTVEAPEPENPANAVQMMTVHAAKGLEFPVVFIMSVARQRFPHREERPVIEFPDELRKGPPVPPDIHLQEERRLFYVAMTRARERLYVSSVGARGKKPSVFVDDLLSDPVVRARDIERIEVAQAAAEVQAGPAPRVAASPASPARSENPTGQGSLFAPVAGSGYVHPDLERWASRAPEVNPNGKLQLSATAIEDYRECPLKFKYRQYYRIPTAAQAALTFGSLMHQSVRHYFRLRREGAATFEAVRDFYLRSWKDVGFEDSYQEQTYKKAGLEQLREFVERNNASPVASEDIALEERFTLDLGDVVLDGRIDQINPLTCGADIPPAPAPAGARRTAGTPALPPVELIDYKTGRPRSQKDADKSLQLSIYALAAKRLLQVNPVRLTFYNLTNNQPVSTIRTAKDLDKALGEIRDVATKIRSLLFDPKPGFACKYCDFVPICPAHEEEA